jgi:phosphatidylglycerol:prolipoprotein diacylglycerol transferase
MLPDLQWASISLGPLTIQVWGLFVALGMATALVVARQFAKMRQLDPVIVVDAAFWIILAALIGSRLFFVATEWAIFAANPIDILKIWHGGMSVSGGFIGSVIAAVIYFRYKKVSAWEYAEVIVYALPLGLFIGRLGCFFIFDHPGTETNFFLGEVYYLDGVVRHNHGLYLSLSGLLLFSLFTYFRFKTKPQAPYFVTGFLVWDGIVRLWLDNYRISDAEFWGLTAAQWMGLVSIIAGLAIFGQRQNIRKHFLSKNKSGR